MGSLGDGSGNALFTPYKFGPFQLEHRIVLAPLTRCRAYGTIPQPAAITYYTQRATKGGFMLSEGTCVSQQGQGYPCVPGLYLPEQLEAWKPIVAAVKAKDAVFFAQLWHVGRCSHNEYQPDGALPVAPSAIPFEGLPVYTSKGPLDPPVPRALETDEIPGIVEQYRASARAAIDVGFDGVEVHAANGYLLDEFLKDGTNKRTDRYGGSVENRVRLLAEVVDAVAAEVGAERVGVRLSPFSTWGDVADSDPVATNLRVVEELNRAGVLYSHWIEPRISGNAEVDAGTQTLAPFRKAFKNTFIAAGGFKAENGSEAISSGVADLVTYGRLFLANPDLPRRFQLKAPLNKYDRNTFYTQDQIVGYTDYPFLEESEEAKEAGEGKQAGEVEVKA
eukprot:jgi/Mesen1/2798/ME000172S01948